MASQLSSQKKRQLVAVGMRSFLTLLFGLTVLTIGSFDLEFTQALGDAVIERFPQNLENSDISESITKVIQNVSSRIAISESKPQVYFWNHNQETIHVLNEKDGTISFIELEKISTIRDMAISDSTNKIFITNERYKRIDVIDTNSNKVIGSFPAFGYFKLNDVTKKLYMMDHIDSIKVYDISNETYPLETSFPVERGLDSITINDRTNTAYINFGDRTISIIDLTDNTEVAQIPQIYGDETLLAKSTNSLYLLERGRQVLSIVDLDNKEVIKRITKVDAHSMAFSENLNRLYLLGKNNLWVLDANTNKIIRQKPLPGEMNFYSDITISPTSNLGYITAHSILGIHALVLDLECNCPSTEEEIITELRQKITQKENEQEVEKEAQEIVRNFESNSLSVASPSNEEGKIIFDYMEEFFVGHKEKFNPKLARLAPLIGEKDPYGTLDVILDDAGLKAQFYQGFVAKWKEIFKNKLHNIDYLHEQAVIQIRDLKIEEPKKEYYITELNKKAETTKDYLLLAASTVLQPLEEKARVSEDQQSIRAELEGYSNEQLGGGCLIATATYGTELAPQVQQLREIRDNAVLRTNSGSVFMSGFNQFYYSFSPTVADWERQNSVFKESIKVVITPLLTTLLILNYVDIDSEQEMLGYGIGIILLNVGMYAIMPAVVIFKVRKIFHNN